MMGSRLSAGWAYVSRSAFFSAKGYLARMVKGGPRFYETLADLERTQWLTEAELRELQERKLRSIVRHAYNTVPYYLEIFKSRGIGPDEIRSIDDLSRLPILTKETLRARHADLVSRSAGMGRLASGWTTGSTGTPINALRDRGSVIFEHAMIWRQKRWAGVDVRDRKVALWGTIWNNVIIPSTLRPQPPFWRFNAADNQMLFSYFHMSEDTLPLYVKKLAAFRPAFIEGFPSTLLILARHLRTTGGVLPVKAVFTSSEVLYDVIRKDLEESFQAPVFDLYGQAERVVAATECERHEGMHVNPEYGILELIMDGRQAAPGEAGVVVGTGLNNYAMPLLRYETGDIGRLATRRCSCGRTMPLLAAVEGRFSDVIRTADGRIIPGNGLMGALHGIANVRRTQIIQEELRRLRVRIEREDSSMPVDVAHLRRNLEECVGAGMQIEFDMVASVAEPGRTKYQWMISRIEPRGTGKG
jgi:phenylacetate-CoA ligase